MMTTKETVLNAGQLELGFATPARTRRPTRRRRWMPRARWWFQQMHVAVDRAMERDNHPAKI